jgi:hypothetical protein
MSHYCGCRDMPLRGYIAEHERVINLGGAVVRALERGDQDHARSLLASMADELGSRWRGEEERLFAVMASDELSAQHIEPLVGEHRELAALLEWVAVSKPRDQHRVRRPSMTCTGTLPKRRTACSPRH